MSSCGIVYVASLVKVVTVVQATSRFCLSNLRGYNVGISDGLVCEVCRLDFYGVMAYTSCFMTISSVIQVIMKFITTTVKSLHCWYYRSRYLLSTPLRQVHAEQVSRTLIKALKQ
jgi:hypothetical protein